MGLGESAARSFALTQGESNQLAFRRGAIGLAGTPAMIRLRWAKAKDGWLPLALPWPSVIDGLGVLFIRKEATPSRVVRVGHGEIREPLHYHQEDPEVLAYSRFGTLRITWAGVQSNQMEGVERYLVEHGNPLVEARPP